MKKKINIINSLYEKHKSKANSTAIGLNAAAIIFLYAHFVSVKEYDELEQLTKQIQTQVSQLKNEVEVLKVEVLIANPTFPSFIKKQNP